MYTRSKSCIGSLETYSKNRVVINRPFLCDINNERNKNLCYKYAVYIIRDDLAYDVNIPRPSVSENGSLSPTLLFDQYKAV